jgi:ketosteroid isomerase-like protein
VRIFERLAAPPHRVGQEVAVATRNDQNVARARQIFAWFAERDMDSFLSGLAEDVRARPSIDGAPVLRGRDEVARWWARLATLDREVEVRPLDFEAHGDCVVVRGYLRHRTGRTLAESQAYWLCEIHDGQVTRLESYPSRNAALASCAASGLPRPVPR